MENTYSPFEPGYIGNADSGVLLVDDEPEAQAGATQLVGEHGPEIFVPSGDEGGTTKVPAGTVDDVLAWVGHDRGRAETALAVEETRDKPRAGVVGPLTQLLAEQRPSE